MCGGTASEGRTSYSHNVSDGLDNHGRTSLTLPVLPEDNCPINKSDEPKDHVREQDPHSILHADDAAVALGILFDVHLAEDAKGRNVQDEHDKVDAEKEPGLDEWEHADDRPNRRKRPGDGSVHPLGVVLDAHLMGAVEVLCVEADDNDAHDALEEAHEDAEDGARRHACPERVCHADLFALHRAAR
jgi:hypothetical protein